MTTYHLTAPTSAGGPLRLNRALAVSSLLLVVLTSNAIGQSGKLVNPKAFGLNLAPGKVDYSPRRVTTANEAGKAVVGKVHVSVGDSYIVLLPNGELVARSKSDTPLTERPFRADAAKAIAKELLNDKLSGFRTRISRHYVFLYNTSEPFAVTAMRIMESMYPGVVNYAHQQRIKVHNPIIPLVVVMFRTEAEFQRYRRMPKGVVAYYNTLTNRVILYERSRLRRTQPQMAMRQSISTMAHEGAHQILHNIGVQKRLALWPMWVTEGLAEFFAPTTFGKRMLWKGAGKVNDMRMFELDVYLKGRAEVSKGDLIKQTVTAARLTSAGYASAWSLTHFLAMKRRREFHRYVREVSQLRPLEGGGRVVGPGVIPANQVLFEKHFGKDLAKLEKRLIGHLKSLPYRDPFAAFPHYLAMIISTDESGKRTKRNANAFHSRSLAESWRRKMAEKHTNSRTAVRRFTNRAAAQRYARQWLKSKK